MITNNSIPENQANNISTVDEQPKSISRRIFKVAVNYNISNLDDDQKNIEATQQVVKRTFDTCEPDKSLDLNQLSFEKEEFLRMLEEDN